MKLSDKLGVKPYLICSAVLALTPLAADVNVSYQHLEEALPQETVSEERGALYWVLEGLRNNFNLEISQMEVSNADDMVIVTLGEFTPRATARARFSRSDRAQNQRDYESTGRVARIFSDEVASLQVGLEGKLSSGTTFSVTTGTSRLDNTFNQRTGSLYHPEYQSVSQLQLVQPLLRGRGKDANMAAVNLARSEVLGAEYEVRTAVDQVVAQVLIAYVETEFGFANLAVKEDAVELANNLVKENKRRLQEGMMTPVDVTQAEVRLAEAMGEVVGARTFLYQRQNRLLELTGRDYQFGTEVQIGGSAQGLLEVPNKSRVEMARQMLLSNPLYLAALNVVEEEGIRIAYAKNQVLPQLDLEMTYGYNGLNDSFRESYANYGVDKDPDWSVGLVFSVPLSRRAEKAQLRTSRRSQEQALLAAKQAEIQLLVLLDNSVSEVESARERIGFANETVRLEEEAFHAEGRRLNSGLTTSFNVATQQRQLSFARTQALAAEVEHFRALTQLYLVQGTLSEQLNLEVKTAASVMRK